MIEREVAEWVAGFRYTDAPPAVRDAVERIFLDAIASGVAGRRQQLVREVEPVARTFAGGEGPVYTAFVGAYSITSATACDVYRPGLCHVSPVTVPPLLALAEEAQAECDDFLAALTVGLELAPRLCLALNYPELRRRGWHSPGVVGTVAAAAASARLLQLDGDGVVSAMAHGAAQAAGTFAALGTEAVKFNQARGAAAALLAALMARAGLAASAAWLTADDGGMASTYTHNADPRRLTARLGDDWELMQISLRRWPAASSVQSLIDACLDLNVDPDDVVSARVALAPQAYQVSGPRAWGTTLEAQQSARWVAAAVLVDHDWWLEHSDPTARLGDRRIDTLARRIEVVEDEALPSAGVTVEVELASGDTVHTERACAPGDPDLPLTRAQIEEKLRRASAAALNADEILHAVETGLWSRLGGLLSQSAVEA